MLIERPDGKMPGPDFAYEARLRSRGLWPIAGIDEAGRGPLAGPVAAAAVILDPRAIPEGLDDSKRLSPLVRETLYVEIMRCAASVSIAFASAAEIDQGDIRQSTLRAMRRAIQALPVPSAFVLIDGRDIPRDLPCPGEAIVNGDATCASIAAASIVAKVTRDRLMARLARAYPAYGFEQHMGYATKAHLAAIEAHGPCPFHRLSFRPFRDL
jgi:ribonuclease HII